MMPRKKQVIRRLVGITLSRSSRGFCLRVTKADYDAAIPAEKRDIVGRNHFCYAIRAVDCAARLHAQTRNKSLFWCGVPQGLKPTLMVVFLRHD
jgi:hypothetical protein